MDTIPTPVRSEMRTSFGISWFATVEEAERYAIWVRQQGITHNGGFLHGMPCGRSPAFDRDGLYAVTD